MKLPLGWECTTLGDVTEIASGMGFPKHLQGKAEGALPVFKVGDISSAWKDGQTMLTKAPNYVSREEANNLKGKILPSGTVVFAKIGEALRLNRRARLGQPSLVDNNVMGLIPHVQILDEKYLFYFMVTVDLGELSRATAVPSVRKSDVQNVPFPLAPLNEQTRIVAEIEKQFSRLDEAVANLKRVKANLKRYKAAVLKAAVEGKLTEEWRKQHPDVESADKLLERILEERRASWQARGKYKEPVAPDTSGLPELPAGWVWVSLGQIIDEPKYGTSKKCDYSAGDVGVLRIPNVVNGFVDPGDLKSANFDDKDIRTYALKAGDLLTIRSNGSVALVGQCALIRECDTEYLYAGYLIRIRPMCEGVSSEYLMACMSSHLLRQQIEAKAKSTSGVNNINSGELQSLVIPLCSREEQDEIVKGIESMVSITSAAETQVEANLLRADRLRQSILKKAFAGKLANTTDGESKVVQGGI